jgi:hypothetical protein
MDEALTGMLLKKAHLLRCPHSSSLRRTSKYASLLSISGALHLGIFEQPAKNDFFNLLRIFWNSNLRLQIET